MCDKETQKGIDITIEHFDKVFKGKKKKNKQQQNRKRKNPEPIQVDRTELSKTDLEELDIIEAKSKRIKMNDNNENKDNNHNHNQQQQNNQQNNQQNEEQYKSSLILPFEDIPSNDTRTNEMKDELNGNMKQLNKIQQSIYQLPSLKIAEQITDKFLYEYFKDIDKYYKNEYELKCISYKIALHLAADFIPKAERIKVLLNENKIRSKTNDSYNYIKNTLNTNAGLSLDNYKMKLNEKLSKYNYYDKLIKNIQIENNKIIKNKRKDIETNKGNLYPVQSIKNAILINFNAECNYLFLKITQARDYYNDEYIKFRDKTIIQFQKLTEKLKIKIQDKYL